VRVFFALLILIFNFLFLNPALAVSVTISDLPASVTDQPFTFNVSVSGAQSGTNYLRANLFKTGTTDYFGFTNNGTSFYNGSDYSQYLPITIDSSGNWSGTLTSKVDTSSNNYQGPGEHSIKVRRYTSSGSSYTWSNESLVTISLPTPTPIPTNTPTPSATNTPTPTLKPTTTPKPEKTPTPTSQQTPTSTTKQTGISSSTSSPPSESGNTEIPPELLVDENNIAGVSTEGPSNNPEFKQDRSINPFFIITGCLLFIISGGILYIRKRYFS
jgi:hypothetical protein